MSDQTNDDLLNELNAMPETEHKKKKKKKAKPNKNVIEEAKEEEENDETKKEEPEDKQEEPEQKTKKKKKKKTKNDSKQDEENDNKEEETQEKEIKKSEPEPEPEPEKKEEKNEENQEEDKDEDKDEDEEKDEGPKKKKKIIKKVVKKKGKKKDDLMILKILQEQKKKEKELEEKLIKEEAERERKEKEEEERLKKEEEERIAKELALKEEEEKKKQMLKKLNMNQSEYEKLQQNKKKTEEMLQKQGIDLNQFLDSLKDKKVGKKKKKTKKDDNNKNEDNKKEIENKNEENEEQDINDEEIKNKAKNALEVGEKKLVAENNDDVEDWENEIDDNEKEKETVEKEKDEEELEETKKVEISKKQENKNVKEDKENKKEKKKDKKGNKMVKEIGQPKEEQKLRAPIICILGHVDAGKTKILDKLRHSNVQTGEAGGITQQIGATFIPIENIEEHLKKIDKKYQVKNNKIPGILLIDTPGHASFTNLRSRGSSLCDIAVLILNIEKGIEKQSIESMELLRKRKTPFIVALNQIDRTYNWKSFPWSSFQDSYKKQKDQQKRLIDERIEQNKTQFIKNNLNTELYYNNENMKEYINLVPTSAITGEGLPDLLGLLIYLTQTFLLKQIYYKEEIKCSILEVKVLESIGTTIDVILVNGTLHVGDKVVVGGIFGPIKTTIKIILLPHPMKEMRVKCEYDRYDKISGAIGVKLFCPDLENALAGSPLYVYKNEEEGEKYSKEIISDFNSIVQDDLSKKGKGIMVQASTLGSLEAILTYLKDQKIDVAVVGVGNLNKKDVIKLQIKHSEDENVKKEDLVILCFDNKVTPEAQQFADENSIKIFTDDVIYHLFDKYIEFKNQCIADRKKEKLKEAIFPCLLKTVMFINKKDPLILGVSVVEGVLKTGTPIYCVEKNLPIGVVESIEKDKKPINNVKPNDGDVAIRVKVSDSSLAAGRHFDDTSTYISQITRNSIDALKQYFREDMTNDDWRLVIKLKKILNIQ